MNAAVDGPSTVALPQVNPLVPGYLMRPFGWAAKPLAALVQSELESLTHVFELDRLRMHAIALALAHLDDDSRHTLRRFCSGAQSTRFSIGSWADLPLESTSSAPLAVRGVEQARVPATDRTSRRATIGESAASSQRDGDYRFYRPSAVRNPGCAATGFGRIGPVH